jgi:uncharacterized membrane protein YcfT
MFDEFVRTLVKLVVASLILGSGLAYFGVTAEKLLREVGLTPEQAMDLVRRGLDWAMPNITLGAIVIVPVWLVMYLFRPPRPRIGIDGRL